MTEQPTPTLLADILSHIEHGVVVTDHEYRVILANPAATQMLKKSLSISLIVQQNVLSAAQACPPLHKIFAAGLKKAARSEAIAEIKLDEDERHIRVVIEPLEDGSVILLDDITDSVFAERAKSDFVSLTAHQLKTPVAELKGYAENMLSGATGPLLEKQRHYLEQMKQVCDRNFHLIENLLDISQIEEGVITLNLTPIELSVLVEDALLDFSDDIQRKELKLERHGFDKEVIVFADPVKTVEVLKNIVHNALKFTNEGSISIGIEQREEWGVIKITDTGSGINEKQRKELFKRGGVFGTLFMSGHGAGLGLYIAKQFLGFENGTITVLPTTAKGTTFEVKLPKFTAHTPLGQKVQPVQVQLNPQKGA